MHAAGLAVGVEAKATAVALLPQLEQRRRKQRQRTGLALDVCDQGVDEVRLRTQAGALRGQLDRAPQLVAAHRTDQDVVGAHQARQFRICVAAAVEVRAHRHEHDRLPVRVASRGHERVRERRALVLVSGTP